MTAAFDSNVDFAVEFAFGVLPYNEPTSTEWVDASKYVRAVNTDRGRTHELDEISAGTATVRLDNRDRRFDPSNTGSTYSPNVRPMTPVRVKAIHSGTTYPIYTGYVEAWPQTWQDGQFAQETTVKAVDGFRLLSFVETATTWSGGDGGNRVAGYLDEVSWPSTWRSISTGAVDMDVHQGQCSSVLAEIRRVVDTEHGLFFIGKDGAAVFQGGKYRSGGTPTSTFSDTGQIPYVELNIGYDDRQLWNDITVTPKNVAAQSVEDTGSIDIYGRRKLKIFDTLHTSASTASSVASRLLGTYKDPQTRIERIEVSPRSDPTKWGELFSLEISDLVRVNNTPTDGSQISQDVYAEGITHNFNVEKIWTIELNLSPTT